MKKIFIVFITIIHLSCAAQKPQTVIAEKEVARMMNTLADDDMKGRKVYTPEIDKAAAFIASEFKKAGLAPGSNGAYLQPFSLISAKQKSITVKAGNSVLNGEKFVVVTDQSNITISPADNFLVEKIEATDDLFTKAMQAMQSKKNQIILVDEKFADRFSRLSNLKRSFFKTGATKVFVLGNINPKTLHITANHEIKENKLTNVTGILPGKKLKNEYVIFSAHYDHIGIGQAMNGDSIYNGANDDASGSTAVMMLARHFKKLNNNARTLVFVAFTAEEVGGFGSQYFSGTLPAQQIKAMLNIEMIGTDSKWGKNSAYITGYEKTDMGDILQKNLKGSGFNFYADPYPDQQLFYRSDNATLARLGVPAHTISTSKMDVEPHYHKASDEVKTLDLKNMSEIIKSIAISAQTIIAGKDTPTRVKTEDLR